MKRSDLVTLFVLFVMLFAVVNSIVVAEWTPGLGVVIWPMALGLMAGTALAFSSFPGWTAHLTSFIYGLFVLVVIGGTHITVPQNLEWRERLFVIIGKIIDWAREAASNGTSRESLIFILVLCGLFWLLGYTAAWYSFRYRRIWHVILPAGVTLFSNVYYYGGVAPMSSYLVIYLVCALMLLVESHLADREEVWREEGVRFAKGLRASFMVAGLGIGLVALLVAWRAPALASSSAARTMFNQLTEPYNDVVARLNRLFSDVRNYNLQPIDSFGASLILGGPRNLTKDPVMDVTALPNRYFWRAISYDYYDGATWTNSGGEVRELRPQDESFPMVSYLGRMSMSAGFVLYRGTDTLYFPSQPMRASVPAQAVFRQTEEGAAEMLQYRLATPLLSGNRYTGVGSMSIAEAQQLREAPIDYPQWIVNQYLQVPAAVPDRVRSLAWNIAGRETTPYDKAVAIERWLRDNIAYDEKLEAPPPGVEASDYILFDTRRAYCNYYATAMVMMLRSLGVPARMATGYAQGELLPEASGPQSARYRVKVEDAHAWVEVFFPLYGWVEFEPTAGQPPLNRAENSASQMGETQTPLAPTPTPPPPTPEPTPQSPMAEEQAQAPQPPAATLIDNAATALAPLLRLLPFVAILAALIGLAILGLRFIEGAGFATLPPIQRVYAMLSRWATWLGIGNTHTPYEQADLLAQRAPGAGGPARRITDLYVECRYSSRASADATQEADAMNAWQRARLELRKAWVASRLRRLVGR